jgi:hypothetical protein
MLKVMISLSSHNVLSVSSVVSMVTSIMSGVVCITLTLLVVLGQHFDVGFFFLVGLLHIVWSPVFVLCAVAYLS